MSAAVLGFAQLAAEEDFAFIQLQVSVFSDNMRQFNYVFALFVLLRLNIGLLVLPAQCSFAARAEDVGHGVRARVELPLNGRTAGDIYDRIEEVSAAMVALEGARDQLVVVGQVCATMDATVEALTACQVLLSAVVSFVGDRFKVAR